MIHCWKLLFIKHQESDIEKKSEVFQKFKCQSFMKLKKNVKINKIIIDVKEV